MAGNYRFAGKPRWVAGHVVVLAAAVAMVLLGHWQLTVSERKGFSLQNFGYSLQWWAFSIFAIVMWIKIVRDQARSVTLPSTSLPASPAAEPGGGTQAPVAYRRYMMPQSSERVGESDDPEQSAYNAYLASLATPTERGEQ